MRIELTYFRPNGKYYTEMDYDCKELHTALYEYWNHILKLKLAGNLPGLIKGPHNFIILVEVPDHPHNHPHLIMTNERY